MFYSNDATAALVTVNKVIVADPTFAPAWLNVALFNDAMGKNEQAIIAYKKYVALDPKGQNVAYANKRLGELGAAGSTTTK